MKRLTTTTLKWIAVVTMLVDHIAATAQLPYGLYVVMRSIGRLSFPLFAFVLVEGFIHTRNRKRYLVRIFVFALITEVCFDLAFYQSWFDFSHQNVLFTFLISLFVLLGYERSHDKVLGIVLVLLGMYVALILKTDYDLFGILIIFNFYYNRNRVKHLVLFHTVINLFMALLFTPIQLFAVFSLPLITLYNGKKGKGMKYFFYIFYPGHLLLLYCLQIWGSFI